MRSLETLKTILSWGDRCHEKFPFSLIYIPCDIGAFRPERPLTRALQSLLLRVVHEGGAMAAPGSLLENQRPCSRHNELDAQRIHMNTIHTHNNLERQLLRVMRFGTR